MASRPQPDFRITLRALPGWGTSPIIRLRHALKALLRQHGLRCTDLTELRPERQQEKENDAHPDDAQPGA